MKRKLAILLAMIMIANVFGLSSCNNAEPDKGSSQYTDSLSEQDTQSVLAESNGLNNESLVSNESAGSTLESTASSTTSKQTSNNSNSSKTTSKGNTSSKADLSKYKGSTIKLLLWYKPSDNEQAVINKFIKDTNINVKITRTSNSQYLQRASSMIATNDSPDLIKMEGKHFPMMITKKIIQTIDAGKFNLEDSDYAIELMDLFKWGGKYYGVNVKGSTFTDMYMFYYNKTMFDNRGVKTPMKLWQENNWNWDTFLETAKKMTFTQQGKQVYGFCTYAPMAWMLSAGVDFVDINGTSIKNTMNDPKVLKAWQWVCDLRTKHKVDMAKDDCLDQEFIQRQVAMCGAGQFFAWKGGSFDTQMTDKWDAVPWPCPKGQEYVLPVGGVVWCLGAGAKNPEAAAAFIRYWLDPDNLVSEQVAQESMKSTLDWMWNAKKKSLMSSGILDFGGSGDYSKLTKQLANSTAEQVSTELGTWSKKLDGYINTVENEIPKK